MVFPISALNEIHDEKLKLEINKALNEYKKEIEDIDKIKACHHEWQYLGKCIPINPQEKKEWTFCSKCGLRYTKKDMNFDKFKEFYQKNACVTIDIKISGIRDFIHDFEEE